METRVCSWCRKAIPAKEFCADCLAAFPSRPAPEAMTPDERVAELQGLTCVEIQFPMIHERIEKLVGRPVWTHEMGTSGFPALLQEARWEDRPATMEEIIAKVPAEKLLVVEV